MRCATRAAFRAAVTSYIDPGAPWQNPYVEPFNGRVRDELLDVEQFSCPGRSQVVIGDWREGYNHVARSSPYRQRLSGSDNHKPRAPQRILSATTEPLLGSRAACRHGAALLAVQLRRA
jgi:Integrase core domain